MKYKYSQRINHVRFPRTYLIPLPFRDNQLNFASLGLSSEALFVLILHRWHD